MSHLAVAKTYKLFIGGHFPDQSPAAPTRPTTTKTNFMANAALALTKGSSRRRGRCPQGLRRLVQGNRVQPRPGDLPHGRDARGPSNRVRRADHDSVPAPRPGTPPPRSMLRSIVWCTTPAGPTSSPQCSGAPTRYRAPTSPTPLRNRPAWLGSSRHRARRCSAWSR